MNKRDLVDLLDSAIRKLQKGGDLVAAQGELKTVRYWIERLAEEPTYKDLWTQ